MLHVSFSILLYDCAPIIYPCSIHILLSYYGLQLLWSARIMALWSYCSFLDAFGFKCYKCYVYSIRLLFYFFIPIFHYHISPFIVSVRFSAVCKWQDTAGTTLIMLLKSRWNMTVACCPWAVEARTWYLVITFLTCICCFSQVLIVKNRKDIRAGESKAPLH